jgi:hypothetical protein
MNNRLSERFRMHVLLFQLYIKTRKIPSIQKLAGNTKDDMTYCQVFVLAIGEFSRSGDVKCKKYSHKPIFHQSWRCNCFNWFGCRNPDDCGVLFIDVQQAFWVECNSTLKI